MCLSSVLTPWFPSAITASQLPALYFRSSSTQSSQSLAVSSPDLSRPRLFFFPPGRRKNAGSEPSTSRSCSWWASPSRMCPWGNSCCVRWWKTTWGWWCCCWHTAPRRRLTRPTGTETDAQLCTSPARWPTWSLLSCLSGWVQWNSKKSIWGVQVDKNHSE